MCTVPPSHRCAEVSGVQCKPVSGVLMSVVCSASQSDVCVYVSVVYRITSQKYADVSGVENNQSKAYWFQFY